MVDWHEPSFDFTDTLFHELFCHAYGDSVAGEQVGLKLHDVIKLRQRIAFGMMGNDKVDFLALILIQ
ncbi:hypothetical protein ES703_93599 [subsurface metagenome]